MSSILGTGSSRLVDNAEEIGISERQKKALCSFKQSGYLFSFNLEKESDRSISKLEHRQPTDETKTLVKRLYRKSITPRLVDTKAVCGTAERQLVACERHFRTARIGYSINIHG